MLLLCLCGERLLLGQVAGGVLVAQLLRRGAGALGVGVAATEGAVEGARQVDALALGVVGNGGVVGLALALGVLVAATLRAVQLALGRLAVLAGVVLVNVDLRGVARVGRVAPLATGSAEHQLVVSQLARPQRVARAAAARTVQHALLHRLAPCPVVVDLVLGRLACALGVGCIATLGAVQLPLVGGSMLSSAPCNTHGQAWHRASV